MSIFRSKAEKEIEAQMERDEQLENFKEQIKSLKAKSDEYATIAAEAEIAGDTDNYDLACNALIELNTVISSLNQTKTNFDIINVSNSVAVNMANAMRALESMASSKGSIPDIKKIQRANAKVVKYMRNVRISNKALSNSMRLSNPANVSHSKEEIESVKPIIAAARAKLVKSASPEVSGLDISSDIEIEKNRLV